MKKAFYISHLYIMIKKSRKDSLYVKSKMKAKENNVAQVYVTIIIKYFNFFRRVCPIFSFYGTIL